MKLTREGKRFLLAAALIGVAAVNTGNNLIYLILSLMLSFVVLSYLILRLNLKGLVLEALVAGPVFAGERAGIELLVQNNKRLPLYSVSIGVPDAVEPIYCAHIPGHQAYRAQMTMIFRKRGLYGQRDFVVQSGFPYILFRKSIPVHVSGKVLVYPKLLDIRQMIEVVEAREQEGLVAVRGRGDEVYSLRAFQYGDDWRRIHWKASARQDGFLIREYAEYASQRITVLLDNLLPYDAVYFETAVSIAASLAQYFIGRGYLVRLIASGKTISFGAGYEHLLSIFDALALVAEEEGGGDLSGFGAEGFSVAVLKSMRSGLRSEAGSADVVIYADSL